MTTRIIPSRHDLLDYTEEVQLGQQLFNLMFVYNARENAWYMDLSDANEVPIVQGRKLVTNFPLLRLITDLRRPLGEILALDTIEPPIEAGRDDLGERIAMAFNDLGFV